MGVCGSTSNSKIKTVIIKNEELDFQSYFSEIIKQDKESNQSIPVKAKLYEITRINSKRI